VTNQKKPRLRGVLHQWAFAASLATGASLVLEASSLRARLAVAVYALSVAALFGTSAPYHRVDWRTLGARRWMRRLDHTMIFVLIAGSYTPFGLLVLHGTLGAVILITVWSAAVSGGVFKCFHASPSRIPNRPQPDEDPLVPTRQWQPIQPRRDVRLDRPELLGATGQRRHS